MTSPQPASSTLIHTLREHQQLARQILDLVEQETQALSETEALPATGWSVLLRGQRTPRSASVHAS